MLQAITRAPGRELALCELTHLSRDSIDVDRAIHQHGEYLSTLTRCGLAVTELPALAGHPDGVFVEDTAIVLDELAVLTSPAAPSRRGEVDSIAAAVMPFREVVRLPADVTLDGGDVLRVGRTLFVGTSSRTGPPGQRALADRVAPFGYSVVPVKVTGCLHLKSACSALDDSTILVQRDWIEVAPFAGLRLIDVPDEPAGANVLVLPDAVLVSSSAPRTAELLRRLGRTVIDVDVSELHKAEAGLTCMSLVFERLPQ